MSEITIRDLRESDREEWLRLYEGYAEHYRVNLTDRGVATSWGWLMDSDHVLTGIVAELSGQPCGIAHFRAMPSPLRGQEVGFLDDLFVDPDCRGSGIADRLLEAIRQHAIASGWPVVRWITRDNNYRARGLYDRYATKSDWNTYEMYCSLD